VPHLRLRFPLQAKQAGEYMANIFILIFLATECDSCVAERTRMASARGASLRPQSSRKAGNGLLDVACELRIVGSE
jgi:hypothetical protein